LLEREAASGVDKEERASPRSVWFDLNHRAALSAIKSAVHPRMALFASGGPVWQGWALVHIRHTGTMDADQNLRATRSLMDFA
jgi:hypothetical protein